MNLTEKRAAIIADHQAQEKYDPHWKAEAQAGRKISERPIAFLCDDEVVILADDVSRILSGLAAFVEASESPTLVIRAQTERHFAIVVEKAKQLAGSPPDGDLRVHQQRFSLLVEALNEVGLPIVLTDGRF